MLIIICILLTICIISLIIHREIEIYKNYSKPDVWDKILKTSWLQRRDKANLWRKAKKECPTNPYYSYNNMIKKDK